MWYLNIIWDGIGHLATRAIQPWNHFSQPPISHNLTHFAYSLATLKLGVSKMVFFIASLKVHALLVILICKTSRSDHKWLSCTQLKIESCPFYYIRCTLFAFFATFWFQPITGLRLWLLCMLMPGTHLLFFYTRHQGLQEKWHRGPDICLHQGLKWRTKCVHHFFWDRGSINIPPSLLIGFF